MGEDIILATGATWELVRIIDRAMDLLDEGDEKEWGVVQDLRTWSIELLDRIYDGGGRIESVE